MNRLDPILSKACIEITENLLTINQPIKKQNSQSQQFGYFSAEVMTLIAQTN